MPEEINVDQLVSRQESPSTLVRFEDQTDANAPRLNYSVPLPGSFSGKFFIETDFLNSQLPWLEPAFEDRRLSREITDFAARVEAGETTALPPIDRIAVVPSANAPRRPDAEPRFVLTTAAQAAAGPQPLTGTFSTTAITSLAEAPSPNEVPSLSQLAVQFGELVTGFGQIVAEAQSGRAPVFYRTFGGAPKLTFVREGASAREANPRFVIIEHYRLSSFFGDYGAGKTVGVFSLMPGEETTLYIRNWRRSEQTISQASSIFDSFTTEAASEFEEDLTNETTDSESKSTNHKLHSKYSGSGEVNIGLAKTKHSGERTNDYEVQTARETASKNVAKVTENHSSKASSKRESEVTQELEASEAQEFETITERKIKNTNLSRTLNVVTRELNQEFTTYLSLIDVSLAFVNDLNVMEVFQIHEIDKMLSKYLPEPLDPSAVLGTEGPFGVSPYTFVRRQLIDQLNSVYDFQGTRHEFLEEVAVTDAGEQVFAVGQAPADAETYLRVRRSRGVDQPNPFYERGFVPVEGVVMNESRNTVRTAAVIIDSLLGHGVALDNYALGMQQEALRREQNENRRTELALTLIESGAQNQLEAYRSLFGSVDEQLLRDVALGTTEG